MKSLGYYVCFLFFSTNTDNYLLLIMADTDEITDHFAFFFFFVFLKEVYKHLSVKKKECSEQRLVINYSIALISCVIHVLPIMLSIKL